MTIPITPLTIMATLDLAEATLQASQSVLTQGAQSFAELLASDKSEGGEAANLSALRHKAADQLREFQRELVEHLQSADVDTAFPMQVSAHGLEGRLLVGGEHFDNVDIQSVLDAHPELKSAFEELEKLLREVTTSEHPSSRLYLTFNDREIQFRFA